MRSRRDLSRSSSKGCLKRVVIEGLKPPFDKDSTIRTWLARYGTVEEIERFYNNLVVKFSSELQAAEAVRCENGIRSSGSNIKVHLADSETIRQLIQRHSRRKRSLSQQQRRSASSKSESSTRPARKPYLLPPPFPSSRLKTLGSRGLDVKIQAPKRESSAQESREATTSAQLQHQRHSRQLFSTSQSSSEYDVAVLAITHDLVQYAETVQALLHRRAIEEGSLLLDHERQKQQQQEVSELHFRSPRVKIMVLMSVDHIAPCMQDLGEEGVLFAILLNVANMTHNSCTLRILHSSTQQEHRNMPLPDAIDLLLRDFADYLEAEAPSSAGSVAVLKASSPLPLPAPLSPTFQQHLQQSQQQQSHQQTHHHRRCCRHRHRHTSLSSLSTCTSISSSSLSFRSASSSATSSSNHLQKSRRKSHQSQQQKQLRLHHRHHHQQQQHLTREEADTSVTALGAETIPAPDDPNFLAPTRHVAVLLRMLADSRILSVGELDEISAFIAQRRARLTSELTAAESLVHRLSSSPHLCIDTSEALQMNETAFSSASEVIVTPNVGPKEPEFLHREALPVSRYQAIFSDPSNRRRLRAHRGLRGKFRKNGSE
ncbi:nuclear receptor coactivator 5 [Echinococcus multilocularis]|uniref:Nuclear receptor coactivator 5 n=1 Tax=Echinococcus multilocularis TaxID=6211 RepID=A0A068YFS9_ECHMU|nr:nuclear receptor coactivator 5 [Echinococcus multilocularis]